MEGWGGRENTRREKKRGDKVIKEEGWKWWRNKKKEAVNGKKGKGEGKRGQCKRWDNEQEER